MTYRRSIFSGSDMIVTGAAFRLEKGNKDEIKAKMEELLQKRCDKQPMDKPSAGSTFKRPEGAYASALIDSCGLKGFKVGGAAVSEKHAGFVINEGGATFDDVMKLIDEVSEKVFEETGYRLYPEVEIWK
jgi:UDP-N-acetylmuramate dehydrogenase